MSEFAPLALILPFPTSVNDLWQIVNKYVYKNNRKVKIPGLARSKAANAFYNIAKRQIVEQIKKLPGYEIINFHVSVDIVFYPPDATHRDLDNFIKTTFDAINNSECVWNDDALVRELHASWGEVSKPGMCQIFIKPFKNGETQNEQKLSTGTGKRATKTRKN